MNSKNLENTMQTQVNPDHILQVGTGFMASKILLTAVKLELFTLLAQRPMTGREIGAQLAFHERGTWDFLDSLLALGFLEREGTGESALYGNTGETTVFLDKNSPQYIGGILEMANDRLYPFWADLEDGLRTGQPQNEVKHTGESLFAKLYSEPERLEQFMHAMSGVQMGNFMALAENFDFSRYRTLCDVGGASGVLACQVASHHPAMKCTTYDLPDVGPIAGKTIEKFGLSSRVSFVGGDFFEDAFPVADVITMGNILHDWNLEKKKLLIGKAYEALPDGGVFIAIENIIDDERKENTFGLLMSLNMLIETGDGFDYTGAQFRSWAADAGFREVSFMPLTGPTSAAIALK
jgi:hypothetical protein